MPLEILIVLVFAGISAIALLLHFAGRSKRLLMLPDIARAQWLREFPDDIVIDVTLSHDGHAALIRTEEGPGLLWAFGADTVGRRLLDYDWLETPDGVQVYFHDFSAPRVTLHLSEDERRHWRELMDTA